MPSYLISGGAGFIGSHLAEALVKQGQMVRVLDNLSTGKMANLEPSRGGPGELDFIEGDIRDLDTCQRAVEGMDYILHQAARGSVPRSIKNPLATNAVNVKGSINLLFAAKEAGVRRVVLASSSSVYGNVEPPDAPKEEGMAPQPMTPYAVSKVAMEQYASVFYKVYGLETVCLRYFNIFGPRQDPDSAYAAVIPKFLFSVLTGKKPMVFGDGRQSRDFTYVDNVVAANLAACAASGTPGQAINVAAGVSHNLLELLQLLGVLTGRQVEPEFLPARTGDVHYSLADLAKARRLLGYDPKVDFGQGLGRLTKLAIEGRYLT